ncbi:MAG: extracellular solute-binding protein [Deltaproteobacteria bacterium]|nr:extracellular solute-binding protein [Deltaproteobacteria bacterium]
MKRAGLFWIISLALSLCFAWAGGARAAAMDQLVAGAKKEGAVEFLAPSSWPPKAVEMLGEAFDKKYAFHIKLGYSPTQNMAQDVAKTITRAASGLAPEWDVIVVTDAEHATLWLKKLHQAFDYNSVGVDPKLIYYDKGTVSFANQLVLPAYNKKTLPPQDVPKKWEDLLDPKWKGGKLGVSNATHHLARLAVGAWGEEKGTKYVKALAEQKPILGLLGNLYTRLQVGEVQVVVALINGFIFAAEKTGAPVVFAEAVEPVIAPAYHAGVPKGAAHPNAGHLLAVFLTTPEAQEILEKYTGYSSASVRGTKTYKFVQGKKVVYMTGEQAAAVDKLATDYGKILGFN